MSKIEKAYAITDAKISFVSLVDKAANKKQFLITKAEHGSASFASYGRIVNADADSHYITGIVYEPLTEDAHGNYMTEQEITKAAYWFAKNGNQVDVQHSFEPLEKAAVVESYVAPCDMSVGEQAIKKGTWMMTVEVDDPDIFEKVQKGEITGFSMGGVGKYSDEDDPLPDDGVAKAEEQPEKGMRGIFKKMAAALGFDVVEKGEVADNYTKRIQSDNFWTAFYALNDVLYRYNWVNDRWEFASDEETIRNALNDEDSGTFAVIDVLHKKVLGKYHTEHGWKYMTHLYVDEREKCFWAYFGDDKEKVSFADRVKEEPPPEQKPEQPKKENPAAEPSQKQNKKANIIAIAVAVFFAFMLFGGFDLIAPRKRTTSTTRVSTPETNRSILEETALNALNKESAAYISSIDAFYYSGKYTLTVRTVSSGGLYLPIVAEQTAQAVFDKAAELGITLSEYKVEEFSEGNSSKVENLILWKSADGVTGTYTDDTGSSPYIETDVTVERLAEIVK